MRADHNDSAFHMLPIPATSLWSRRASPTASRLIRLAEPREHCLIFGRLREDVGAEPSLHAPVELEHGAVEHHADVLVSPQDEPRCARDRVVPPDDQPTTLHAEMAANDDPPGKGQQQVLADRLDALQSSAVEPRRELLHGGPRVWRLDLELLSHQNLQPPGGAVKRITFGHAASVMSPRVRAGAAGAAAALVWGLQEPLDSRVFRCGYSDVAFLGRGHRSVGFLVHAANGAVFGMAFDAVRRRVDVDQRKLALALALAEHVTLWPLMGLVDPRLVTSARAFAQATYRHTLFGVLLGRLA